MDKNVRDLAQKGTWMLLTVTDVHDNVGVSL
jgi:hypothetical protein